MARAFSEALSGVFSGGYSKSPSVISLPNHGLPHRCLFRARELSESTILIAAIGEVDESNTDDLIDYVQSTFTRYRQIVLDLTRVDFFNEAGFSCVQMLNTRCSRRKIGLVMVPSPEVERTLQVHDPDCALPTAGNIVSAVAALTRTGRGRLRLAWRSA